MRAFESDQPGRLVFTEWVDCPACGTTFEGQFFDDSDTIQDLTEAPQGAHECPECRYEWVSGMTGWTFFSEAG
jgi:hypothetical protein